MTWLKKAIRPELTIFLFLILSIVAGTLLSPNFLDFVYLLHSTTLYAELGLIALCFTLLMTSGEIDLSVASNMTLVACAVGVLFQKGLPMVALIPLALVIGGLLGGINGLLTVHTGLPSLIITIGTLSIYKGLAQVLVGDDAIGGYPSWFLGMDKIRLFRLVPVPLIVLVAVAIGLSLLLNYHLTGRNITAVGLNLEAARYSGVNVEGLKVGLFGLQGVFCGAAALLSLSRLGVAKYSIGVGGEMDVVTMVLLGGTAFVGGSGSPIGTLMAFFVIVFVRTGMRLATISNYVQSAVLGMVLILVIIISKHMERYSKRVQEEKTGKLEGSEGV